ncbi:zinc finger BED domain-containing protein 4-like [Hydra vulgaris]|uniref:Zinc finger BED domain-containing protein 4-like n=1 Tax=Hydra vulgaris TaxID=6087 RepID=A0ABM4DMB9_HYDVU
MTDSNDSNCRSICKIGICKLPVQCPTGATTGLYAHLRAAHPKARKECVARNDENRKRKLAEQELKNENKKQSKVDDLLNKKAHWSSNHPNAIAITNLVGRMLAIDMLPYDFVECRVFKGLMKLMEPQYLVPSRTTFSRSVVPELYCSVKQKTANEIYRDFEDIPSYSFTTDLWTSTAQDPFIYFCLSYVSPEFELKTFALENKPFPGEHTVKIILESLEKTIDNWELPRTVPIYALRDNGSNIKSAMNLSQSFYDLSCFDHTFQLTINDAVSEMDGMQRVEAVRKEKDAIPAELAISEKIDNLTNADWKLAEGYHTILAPFEQASRELCGKNYPTLYIKIPTLYGLNQQLQRFINDPSHKGCRVLIARKLKLKLDRQFPQFISALPDAACTFLDKRYKPIFFSEQQQATVVDSLHQYSKEFRSRGGTGVGGGGHCALSDHNTNLIQGTSASAGAPAPAFGSAGAGRTLAAASKPSSLWDAASVQEEIRMYMIEPLIGRNANALDW